MTTSEKRLAMALGGVIGVFGAYKGVENYILKPRAQLQQQIADEQRKQEDLEQKLAPALTIKKTWQHRTATTLPNEVETSSLAFRSDINTLLSRYGLTDSLTLAPKQPKTPSRGPRAGFTEISVGVNTEGKLRNLVEFLRDFYQRPYLKRVDSLTINAPTAEVKTRTGASPDPTLSFQLTLSTLLLPEIKGIAATPLDPERIGAPETIEASKLPTYLTENTREYDKIFATNVFKLWEPPKTVPTHTDQVVKSDATPAVPKEPPPVVHHDPRADADQFTLRGTTSLDGQLIAYIADEREAFDPPREAHLNEVVDDGQLILIDNPGIVVRTHQGEARRKEFAYWFYANGKTFADRDRITPVKYPQLHEKIQEIMRLSEAKAALEPQTEAQPAEVVPAPRVMSEQGRAAGEGNAASQLDAAGTPGRVEPSGPTPSPSEHEPGIEPEPRREGPGPINPGAPGAPAKSLVIRATSRTAARRSGTPPAATPEPHAASGQTSTRPIPSPSSQPTPPIRPLKRRPGTRLPRRAKPVAPASQPAGGKRRLPD